MIVKELIESLKCFNPELEVIVGTGSPMLEDVTGLEIIKDCDDREMLLIAGELSEDDA